MKQSPAPFNRNVDQWLQYTESWKGRLRRDLTLHNLEYHVKSKKDKLRVLDAGCGLGDTASRLLHKSSFIVLLDFSEKMIESAKDRLRKTNHNLSQDSLIFLQGPVEDLDASFPEGSFDLILCHTLLEYVGDPGGVLTSLAGRLAPGGLLSLVTANCFSEVFKLALLKKDLAGAHLALHNRDHKAGLFDEMPKQTFSFDSLEALLKGLDLNVLGRYGIRIFADYLPKETRGGLENYNLLFKLEKEASKLSPFLHIARYLHLICRKEGV